VLPKITDYWDTNRDAIPRFAAELSAPSPMAANETTVATRTAVTEHVRVLPDEELLRAAVAIADDLYRAARNDRIVEYLHCRVSPMGLAPSQGVG
jgi:hypothetical protein